MFLKVFRKSSLFLSSYLPCWSKSPQDRLKIAPRTRQHGPRRPTSANMGPTWGQHGAQKRPQNRSKGPKIWSRRGLELEPLPNLAMDPKLTPQWTPNGPQFASKMDPTLIPNGAKIDSTSTINPFQISSKIDLEIHFMLTILISTSPPGRQAQEALSSSLWCLFFWSQVFRLFR